MSSKQTSAHSDQESLSQKDFLTTRSQNLNLFSFYSALVLALAGIASATYAIMHHMALKKQGVTDFSCNINQQFSCDAVANSAYSEVFGIPLGFYGLGFFLGILFILFYAFREDSASKKFNLIFIYIAMAIAGVVSSGVLATISATVIKSYCLSCIATYLITLLQGVVAFSFYKQMKAPFDLKGSAQASAPAFAGLLIALLAFNIFGTSMPQNQLDDAVLTPNGQKNLSTQKFELPVDKTAYSGFGEDYRYGSDDAKVVVVEFADFQCPACSQMAALIKRLKEEYKDRVLFVFKNYPLDQKCNPGISRKLHEFACDAAVLARCVGTAGKFWQFHDLLFENQDSINSEQLQSWALKSGLSQAQIQECLTAESRFEKIQNDIKQGNAAGVQGTPALYINGHNYIGDRDYFTLRMELEKQLQL
ncbi:MAG: thioredoxin domain-containing protein [Oligoflexales bacterium]|nr:thioredoxin domain-containing protein [Oligoflexales bacterium]